ncbi:type VII secretion integral membrane protein EccD [Mycobacterium sp. NPDC051804]|uniref:type VII secretion integral membrane protein EccD n=1 Tax=Mycobacterium sp. NPDC051804 TaxID=3364295 RepID=UPI00379B42C0
MPDSLCRLTVASCTADTHRAIDLELPADVDVGELLPQIVDLVHRDSSPMPGLDWLLSRLGEPPLNESATLNDNDVRDGDVLILATAEPLAAERAYCDPCHAMTAEAAPVPRAIPATSCILLSGFGAVVLVWPAADVAPTSRIVVGACLILAAAGAAVTTRRLVGDALICATLSLIAVLYAGAVGFLTVRSGTTISGLLVGSAAVFAAAILLLRVIDCSSACLTAVATVGAVISAIAVAGTSWRLPLDTGGAALVVLSLATLGLAPRLSMALSGTTPAAAANVRRCHQTLTGLVVGSSFAAALGAAAVAVDAVRSAESGLRSTSFIAIVALVLLLRVRTHVDAARRSGLAAAATLCTFAALASAAIAASTHAHVISVLAAILGAVALGCLVRPTVNPLVQRITEVVEYIAVAAVFPMACWIAGVYGWAREVSLA